MIDANSQWMLRRDAQLCGDASEQNVLHRANTDDARYDLHTCLPGVISSFDPSTMTAEVQPAIQRLVFPDGAAAQWVNLPLIVDVPVVVLSGGGYALTFPIHPGDECLLIFAERSLDNWHEQGGISQQAHSRMHSLSDAFVLVGVRSKPNVVTNYDNSGVELRDASGQTNVRLDAAGLHLQQGQNTVDMTAGEIAISSTVIRLSGQVILDHTMQGTGGAGANFSGDVTAGSVSLMGHQHTGVQSGSSISGPPKP